MAELRVFILNFCECVWPVSALVQVSMVHFSLVFGLFCKVLTQDPGTLDRADADPRFSCIADLVENNQSPHRFCPYCEVIHPEYCFPFPRICLFNYQAFWYTQPSSPSKTSAVAMNRCCDKNCDEIFMVIWSQRVDFLPIIKLEECTQ